MSDSVEKLRHAVDRVERMLGEKAVKHSRESILDHQQAQADIETVTDAASGYGVQTPQEVRLAQERNSIRVVLNNPAIRKAALDHGVSAEMVVDAILAKGPDAMSELDSRKTTEALAELVGLEPKGSEGDGFFGRNPGVKSTPAQKARLEEIAKKGKADDDVVDAQLKILGF